MTSMSFYYLRYLNFSRGWMERTIARVPRKSKIELRLAKYFSFANKRNQLSLVEVKVCI